MSQQLPEEILYDKRLQERFIRQGLLTSQQLQTWLTGLSDVAEQGEVLNFGEAAPGGTAAGDSVSSNS